MNPLDDLNSNPFEVAAEAAEVIAKLTGVAKHDIALTLGSGWAKAADLIGETVATLDASEIPGFSKAAVVGHVSTIRSIALPSGKHALVLGARTHLYEGHGVRRVVHGVRTAAAAGVTTMILTNGAGGIKSHWSNGIPVLITNHINLTATSPLEGATFIDLTDLYSPSLRELVKSVQPNIEEGVYTQLRGPHYETPAEVHMVKVIGGDLVGMSTGLEAIAAREAGMEILGLSLMTNLAAGIQDHPLSHEEVLAAGKAAEPVISALLAEIVAKI